MCKNYEMGSRGKIRILEICETQIHADFFIFPSQGIPTVTFVAHSGSLILFFYFHLYPHPWDTVHV